MSLSVKNLSVVRSGRTILQPTSLQITPASRLGVVGASGSGKSTLGHALIDALREKNVVVAHVPQSPDQALDPLRSLKFHWREAEKALGLAHNVRHQQSLFKSLKIEQGDLNKRPWGWSRGMQQRFVIAMALIGSPELIVLDEPTSALDPIVAADTMTLLQAYLAKHNTAMMLITHDLGLVAQRVERLLVMEGGAIVEDQAIEDILTSPKTVTTKSLCAHKNWLTLPC